MKSGDKQSSAERIRRAALAEFSTQGFSGARVERIARRAKVNKAMIFYHFGSKRGLFQTVLQGALGKIFREIGPAVQSFQDPETFLEVFPEIYIRHFARHPELIRLVGLLLIQETDVLVSVLQEIASSPPLSETRPLMMKNLLNWYQQGRINEPDPQQIMLSVVGLSLFPFIGLPLIETFTGSKTERNDEFTQRRIESVVRLLKQGMLP